MNIFFQLQLFVYFGNMFVFLLYVCKKYDE